MVLPTENVVLKVLNDGVFTFCGVYVMYVNCSWTSTDSYFGVTFSV